MNEENAGRNFFELVSRKIAELHELWADKFFQIGDHFGLEQFFDNEDEWNTLSDEEKKHFLEALGAFLNVDLLTYVSDDIICRYWEEGVAGQPSEKGAKVEVLATKYPFLEVHVFYYINEEVGTRYDLVCCRKLQKRKVNPHKEIHRGFVAEVEDDYVLLVLHNSEGQKYERNFEADFLSSLELNEGDEVEVVFSEKTGRKGVSVLMVVKKLPPLNKEQIKVEIEKIMSEVDLKKIEETLDKDK